jgi:hypothetical protein
MTMKSDPGMISSPKSIQKSTKVTNSFKFIFSPQSPAMAPSSLAVNVEAPLHAARP